MTRSTSQSERRGIDPASVELARHFLADRISGTETTLLQDAVEDWFEVFA